jgi:hypothetical protein
VKKQSKKSDVDAAARAQHARFVAELEREGYLKLARDKPKPRRKPDKKRRSRTAGKLSTSFTADTGPHPVWEKVFKTFVQTAEDAGAAEAIRMFEVVLRRARRALVKPERKRRGLADPEGDMALLGAYEEFLRQGKKSDEALALLVPDDPSGNGRPALLRRLQRLRRRLKRQGDN